MARYSKSHTGVPGPSGGYKPVTCRECGSTVRLFVQCQKCLLRFINATDVASKSSYYKPEHLHQQRSY